MKNLGMFAALTLAASQLIAGDGRVYPDVRDEERRRNTPKTFSYRTKPLIKATDEDLLGKSHGTRSKRQKRKD